jgi:hypothetical protein
LASTLVKSQKSTLRPFGKCNSEQFGKLTASPVELLRALQAQRPVKSQKLMNDEYRSLETCPRGFLCLDADSILGS